MQEIEKAKEEFLSKIWKTKPKDYDFALSPYLQNDKKKGCTTLSNIKLLKKKELSKSTEKKSLPEFNKKSGNTW